ncbi:MTH895/ArsE family thioredoxin-like protein [Haloimpatiens sp. FM7315]|uniref:MTH895/ArsE family thioredoxin-like protein n=1 Tax=Haloimpatiens sp. FM7315 TaxID=3298609 RepID=UPI0035A27D67
MQRLLDFFKILSDETRLRIILLLWNKSLCVCELCNILDLSQPKVSRHLAKLRDSGIVKDSRQGQWIFYNLDLEDEVRKNAIEDIIKNIGKYPILYGDSEKFRKRTVDYKVLCKKIESKGESFMNIKILGAGCDKCSKLEENVKEALKELKIEASVEKVEDLKSIMAYGVMTTPALVVDEKVKAVGRILSKDEIKKYL